MARRAPTAGAALRLITVIFAEPSRKSNVLSEPTGIESSTLPTTVTDVSWSITSARFCESHSKLLLALLLRSVVPICQQVPEI